MAIQTFAQLGNSYSASATVGTGWSDIQAIVTHEWGDSLYNHTRIALSVLSGESTIKVVDPTNVFINNPMAILDGNIEIRTVIDIDGDIVTLDSPLLYSHSAGAQFTIMLGANYSGSTATGSIVTDAVGKYKIKWFGTTGSSYNTTSASDQFFNVYQPYIDSSTFFGEYPELETDFEDYFVARERQIANQINTICGQSFGSYIDKSITLDGSGRKAQPLGMRLERFSQVSLKDDWSDISTLVEFDPQSKYYLRFTTGAKWGDKSEFVVVGDWGWDAVPVNITEAASLLVADSFNDDLQFVRHGGLESYMDTHRLRFDSTILGGTGNIDADVLLMDYTLFSIGQI